MNETFYKVVCNITSSKLNMNVQISNADVEEMMKLFPEAIYTGKMYRYCSRDSLNNRNEYVSYSKDSDTAIDIVNGICGFVDKDNYVLVEKEGQGLELVRLLRLIKNKVTDKEQREELFECLSNFSWEQEVLAINK